MDLTFELLQACNISEIEVQLVLTGVDYKEGKEKKNLLSQMKESLKKFVGRSVIDGKNEKLKAVESTYVTREEMTLLLKQNKKKRKVSNSEQKEGEGRNANYKGKCQYKLFLQMSIPHGTRLSRNEEERSVQSIHEEQHTQPGPGGFYKDLLHS